MSRAFLAERQRFPHLFRNRDLEITDIGVAAVGACLSLEPERRYLIELFIPFNFKPTMRFPLRVKIPLSTGILLLIALGWAAWGIIREVRLKSRPA